MAVNASGTSSSRSPSPPSCPNVLVEVGAYSKNGKDGEFVTYPLKVSCIYDESFLGLRPVYIIHKRYKNFEDFYAKLIKHASDVKIPRLPEKSRFGRTDLDERRSGLQAFLDELIQCTLGNPDGFSELSSFLQLGSVQQVLGPLTGELDSRCMMLEDSQRVVEQLKVKLASAYQQRDTFEESCTEFMSAASGKVKQCQTVYEDRLHSERAQQQRKQVEHSMEVEDLQEETRHLQGRIKELCATKEKLETEAVNLKVKIAERIDDCESLQLRLEEQAAVALAKETATASKEEELRRVHAVKLAEQMKEKTEITREKSRIELAMRQMKVDLEQASVDCDQAKHDAQEACIIAANSDQVRAQAEQDRNEALAACHTVQKQAEATAIKAKEACAEAARQAQFQCDEYEKKICEQLAVVEADRDAARRELTNAEAAILGAEERLASNKTEMAALRQETVNQIAAVKERLASSMALCSMRVLNLSTQQVVRALIRHWNRQQSYCTAQSQSLALDDGSYTPQRHDASISASYGERWMADGVCSASPAMVVEMHEAVKNIEFRMDSSEVSCSSSPMERIETAVKDKLVGEHSLYQDIHDEQSSEEPVVGTLPDMLHKMQCEDMQAGQEKGEQGALLCKQDSNQFENRQTDCDEGMSDSSSRGNTNAELPANINEAEAEGEVQQPSERCTECKMTSDCQCALCKQSYDLLGHKGREKMHDSPVGLASWDGGCRHSSDVLSQSIGFGVPKEDNVITSQSYAALEVARSSTSPTSLLQAASVTVHELSLAGTWEDRQRSGTWPTPPFLNRRQSLELFDEKYLTGSMSTAGDLAGFEESTTLPPEDDDACSENKNMLFVDSPSIAPSLDNADKSDVVLCVTMIGT